MQSTAAPAVIAQLERDAQVRRVAFPQGQVEWRGFGEGPPLVLLHGGHGSWLHWARNIPALARTHRVWVPNLPGYGDSTDPVAPTLDSLVEALSFTLDAIVGAGTPVRIAGFSFGGLAGARLAQWPRGELRTWRDLPTGSAEWTAVMRHNLLMHMLHADAAVDEVALAIHGRSCLGARFPSKRISLSGGLAAALEGFPGRLLLLNGEHDVTITPDSLAYLVMDVVPGARGVTVPEVGHWVQFEAPEAVNEILSGWLAQD